MGLVSRVPRSGTIETVRHDCQETDTSDGDVLSEIAKRVLWPESTAAYLAVASGCSVRQAERYLGGHGWSGDAVAAVMTEILKRRGMRNLRIIKR